MSCLYRGHLGLTSTRQGHPREASMISRRKRGEHVTDRYFRYFRYFRYPKYSVTCTAVLPAHPPWHDLSTSSGRAAQVWHASVLQWSETRVLSLSHTAFPRFNGNPSLAACHSATAMEKFSQFRDKGRSQTLLPVSS